MNTRIYFWIVLLMMVKALSAQDLPDFQWWTDAHNWDGVTHWSRYIIRSPGYMGPNALPIPLVNNARVDSNIEFESAFEYHRGRGEMAYNPYLNLTIPAAKEKVALSFIYRPFEYYETEEFIRYERYGRNQSCKGFAKGDLYVGTIVHILNQEKHFFDGNLDIFLKTTTGKDLANARHIDAPAYYFDLNLGKKIYESTHLIKQISFYSMLGMYVWQADFNNNRQNDAYLYGLKMNIDFGFLNMDMTYSGYSGYMNLRDKPMALRYNISKKLKNSYFYISYQDGLRDIIYNSFRLGFNYSFK